MAKGRSRGTVRKRAAGKYLIRVYVGKVDGKRKYKSKVIEGSKTDAEKALTALKYEVDTGTYSDPSNLTVAKWTKEWLAGKGNLKETTRMDYETRLRLDVNEHVGHLKLEDLRPSHCRKIMAQMDDRGLSQRTKQYGHMIFNQCMAQAHKDGLIPSNPMASVERPSVTEEDKVQEINTLSREEVSKLLESSKGTKYYPLWFTLLTTGLRPSEALALEWEHIDFEKSSIFVNQSMSRVDHGEYRISSDLKTKKSRRRVPLPQSLGEALRAHRGRVQKKQMLIGKRSDLVFPNGAFAPMDISNVRRAWKRALETAGLREIRLYDARHSFATSMLNAKMSPKLASEILGHASTKQFLDTYTHVTDRDREAAAEEVQKALFG